LDLGGAPRLVEPVLRWAVQPKQREPTFAWPGLHPVALMPRRCRWTEVNINRTVAVGLHTRLLVADARQMLIGLQFGASLPVVKHDRPELLRRDVARQAQFVVPAAIERLLLRVEE